MGVQRWSATSTPAQTTGRPLGAFSAVDTAIGFLARESAGFENGRDSAAVPAATTIAQDPSAVKSAESLAPPSALGESPSRRGRMEAFSNASAELVTTSGLLTSLPLQGRRRLRSPILAPVTSIARTGEITPRPRGGTRGAGKGTSRPRGEQGLSGGGGRIRPGCRWRRRPRRQRL